jgi:Transglutaminase-like superfamily
MRSQSEQYYLAAHVHVCATKDYVVILDTRRNKFMGVSGEHLSQLVAHGRDVVSPETATLIEQMRAYGMLTTSKPLRAPTQAPEVLEDLYEGFVPFLSPIERHHLWNTLQSRISAWRALRTGDIASQVARANHRALRNVSACTRSKRSELEVVRSLIASFSHCRTWLFTAAGACLLDSIATHDFLSRYGLSSSLVVGVRTSPFAAHAWVQIGSCVVNDRSDLVRGYQPIYWSD